jgi:hypothetical protein
LAGEAEAVDAESARACCAGATQGISPAKAIPKAAIARVFSNVEANAKELDFIQSSPMGRDIAALDLLKYAPRMRLHSATPQGGAPAAHGRWNHWFERKCLRKFKANSSAVRLLNQLSAGATTTDERGHPHG